MTYTVTNTEPENAGSQDAVIATVDITSLDTAGFEPFDADAQLGISGADRFGIAVRGLENPQYRVVYDHINGQFDVTNVSDGTDVAQGTDVGEVVIEARGT
jgi:hypothetical protein